MTTLTIDLDEKTLTRAKELAAIRGVSVSEMVSRLVRVATQPLDPEELSPRTRASLGMLSPMSDEEVEKAIEEYRMEKYGK